jgi:hypothetical protein
VRSSEGFSTSNGSEPTDSLVIASSPQLYLRSTAVVSRLVAGETLVLPVRGDIGDLANFYSFNKTATTIWEALEKPRSFREICDVIEHKYEVSRQRAEEDLVHLVQEMSSLGLIHVTVEPAKSDTESDH